MFLRQCSISCTSAVFFSLIIGYFLVNPVELIKTNRDLMGKCILYLDGKWAGDGTGKIS